MTSNIIEHRKNLVDGLVKWVCDHDLNAPAILFFQANKPLFLPGSQLLLILQPLMGWLGLWTGWLEDEQIISDYAMLLEDPQAVEQILTQLEAAQHA